MYLSSRLTATRQFCRWLRKPLLITSIQADKAAKLCYCTGYGHLECASGLGGSTWYIESRGAAAETQGRPSCAMELGKQVYGWFSKVCGTLPSVL